MNAFIGKMPKPSRVRGPRPKDPITKLIPTRHGPTGAGMGRKMPLAPLSDPTLGLARLRAAPPAPVRVAARDGAHPVKDAAILLRMPQRLQKVCEPLRYAGLVRGICVSINVEPMEAGDG